MKQHIGELCTLLCRRLLSRFQCTILDDDDSLEDSLGEVIRED